MVVGTGVEAGVVVWAGVGVGAVVGAAIGAGIYEERNSVVTPMITSLICEWRQSVGIDIDCISVRYSSLCPSHKVFGLTHSRLA